ncbi:TrkA family potassium uptake protein [Saxibacter everestensis]|uniref:TrkA family potassium uptake protein n=1 Tax=Saxibacter everestensis TaxID=2909229 RepID=A0ABY8QYI7_9MICO|nr:TrkA family potassium uptake protein [Brevibacteriaceae bacterium ZFBP1038]
MGCGRVGTTIAQTLDASGHSVAVIDQNESAFLRLSDSFSGTTVTGIGFDRETLQEANITDAYALAAVSSGDNSNILAARVARETFGVSHVVARIYDPGRAEIYQRIGIPTVATVRWTADQVMRRLIPQGSASEFREPSGRLMLAEVHLHESWVGQPLKAIEGTVPVRVAYLTRTGEGTMPSDRMLIQEGDLLHVMMPIEKRDEIAAALGSLKESSE